MELFTALQLLASSVLSFSYAVAGPVAQYLPWSVQAIPPAMKEEMVGLSWRPGCPVRRDQLRLLNLLYVDFQGRERAGQLIMNASVSNEVVQIFRELHRIRFPIDKIVPIEVFNADDDLAMANNATSGFNCREVAGKPGVYSKHSYGIAIDINPVLNPYKSPTGYTPPNSGEYVQRKPVRPGMLVPNGKPVKLFESLGWTWGGRWKNEIDYQHFDKRNSL